MTERPSRLSDDATATVPVSIITGFLGSGKTTLLSNLLKHPGSERIAVIVNEFGEIDLDHALLEASSEDMVMLGNGCLCCTIRGNLVDTLDDLHRRRAQEKIAFDRVIIETSGLADPVPVVRLFLSAGSVAEHYRLDGVVTVVDGVNGASQLDAHTESVRQAAVADRLIVSKTDLAAPERIEALTRRLRTLNPDADVRTSEQGRAERGLLLDFARLHARSKHESTGSADAGSASTPLAHDARIGTFTFRFETPLDRERYGKLLDGIRALSGPNLLRVKGIVEVAGEAAPLALHAVQDIVHAPERLSRRPPHLNGSRLVFITWDVPREEVERAIGLRTA